MSEDVEPGSQDNVEFELPITDTQSMFIMLHSEYLDAMAAGFTHDQAFELVKMMHQLRLEVVQFNANQEDN